MRVRILLILLSFFLFSSHGMELEEDYCAEWELKTAHEARVEQNEKKYQAEKLKIEQNSFISEEERENALKENADDFYEAQRALIEQEITRNIQDKKKKYEETMNNLNNFQSSDIKMLYHHFIKQEIPAAIAKNAMEDYFQQKIYWETVENQLEKEQVKRFVQMEKTCYVSGTMVITTLEECKAAAQSMEYVFRGQTGKKYQSVVPPGCYYEDRDGTRGVWFNPNIASTSDGMRIGDYPICYDSDNNENMRNDLLNDQEIFYDTSLHPTADVYAYEKLSSGGFCLGKQPALEYLQNGDNFWKLDRHGDMYYNENKRDHVTLTKCQALCDLVPQCSYIGWAGRATGGPYATDYCHIFNTCDKRSDSDYPIYAKISNEKKRLAVKKKMEKDFSKEIENVKTAHIEMNEKEIDRLRLENDRVVRVMKNRLLESENKVLLLEAGCREAGDKVWRLEESLKNEKELVADARECKYCCLVDADHVLACGHLMCLGCWKGLVRNKIKNCPVCRAPTISADAKPVRIYAD